MTASPPLSAHAAPLSRLEELDEAMQRTSGGGESLDPVGRPATSLVVLVESIAEDEAEATRDAFAEALALVVEAQLRSFPDNLLYDFDFLAAELWRQAHREGSEPIHELRARAAKLAEVELLFGRETSIQFRYVHDFSYGFDWARWVAREPDARASIGPFDSELLCSILERGAQLLALIEADDAEYPRLPPGQPRNPFTFVREPEEELRLMRSLAADDLIPVRAWDVNERPRWNRPFSRLRRERAAELGLLT